MKLTTAILLLLICGNLYCTDIAICRDGPLRIRNEQNTTSQVIGKILINEKVLITATGKQEKIDNKINNWYKIKTYEGLEGWVFGGYLSKYLLEIGLDGNTVIITKIIYPHDIQFVIDNNYNEVEIKNYFVNRIIDDNVFLKIFGSYGGMLISENYSYSMINTNYNDFIVLGFCYEDKIIDFKIIQKSNSQAYITTGPVVIDNGITDWEVFVIINGPYEKNYNSNIQGAYKANIKEKKIDKIAYNEIKIFLEDI